MELDHPLTTKTPPERRVSEPPSTARPTEKVDVLSCYELRLSSSFLSRRLDADKLPVSRP
jgi:hypothetical protein